nr:YceD family protein [Moraxella osloensis]
MTLHSSSHSSSNVPAQSSKDVPTTAPSKTANNTTSEIGASASLVKFIDLARWEHNNDNHYLWKGKVSLKDLPRIYALGDEHHDNDQPLDVILDIQKKGDVVFWQLHTTGVLWQTCQRCLDPVAVSLDVDSELALLEDENHVALLDEGTEIILIDELTDDNKLWLLPMIEDELLVDLPLAPKHDDCEMAVTEVGELPEAVAEKENPFAVLASLKS